MATKFFLSDLFFYVSPVLGNKAAKYSVFDKGAVIHEFGGREGSHGVKETRGRLLEVTDRHTVGSLVRLQSVPAIPISSFLY